jgi:DNA-binding CsgD family transcriptional regulator
LSHDEDPAPIVISIAVGASRIAGRLVDLLADLPGVRLVDAGAASHAILTAGDLAPAPDASDPLTPREREVLALMATGASNKSIARQLGISTHTVKFHVGSVLDKLDADGRLDAVAQASRLGLLRL